MPSDIAENKTQKFKNFRAKTPTCLQMEATECGAASLGIILGYYKKNVPLEELRLECGVTRDGSKASNVLRAARKFGFEAKGYRKEPEEVFKECDFPVIVFWNFNHFLVVEGFKNNRVFINDPADGPRNISWEEFDLSYTGVVLTFSKTKEFVADGKKPSIINSLKNRLKGSKNALVFVVLAGIFMVIPGIITPIFSKIFIDEYLIKNMKDWIMPLFIAMGVTIIINGALRWLQEYYLLRFETKLALKESSRFFWHIIRLPIEFFNQRHPSEIGSRVEINNEIASVLSGQLATNLIALVTLVFYLVIMLSFDVTLTIIGVGFTALNVILLKKFSRIMIDKHKKIAIEEGKLISISMSGIQSVETLKANGGEFDFFKQWAGYQTKLINGQQEIATTNQLLLVFPAFLTALNIATVLSIGGYRVMEGYLTMGMLVAFQSLMTSFMTPINTLLGMGLTLQKLESDMIRIDDVLKYPIDSNCDETKSKQDIKDISKLDGYVELKNISFGYNRLEKPLIENFNLSLNPGKVVAIIGASGCGKSTVAKIMSSLYPPLSGDYLIDGKKITELPKKIISNSLSIVDQDIFLFEGTINENLTLWDNGILEKDIINACKDACIHDIVSSLSKGYESKIEEGGKNFSGGQRQRLEIARALVNNPSILILDEATSALDPVTEQIIGQNLRRRGCACVIIAHRLSTIRDADEIILLDKGKIVQRGKHDELIKTSERYKKLIQTQ